jgi:hypothetical protein
VSGIEKLISYLDGRNGHLHYTRNRKAPGFVRCIRLAYLNIPTWMMRGRMSVWCQCTKGRNCGHRQIGVLWAAFTWWIRCSDVPVCTHTQHNLARAGLLSIERFRIPTSVNFHEEYASRGYERRLGFLIVCLTRAGCCAYCVRSRHPAPSPIITQLALRSAWSAIDT